MDPRERADALLSRARARGSFVVTPDNAVSPMDASSTLQIQRAVVRAVDPDATTVVTAEEIRENDATAQHHLAERAPTSEIPARPRTSSMPAPNPRSAGAVTQPLAVPNTPNTPAAAQAAAPSAPPEDDAAEFEDVGGLIPTTTQRSTSSLASRLDPEPERPEVDSEFEVEDVGGLVPTTTQRMRSSLANRLDS